MSRLFPHQQALQTKVISKWNEGKRNVLANPTGSGKTVVCADTVKLCARPTAVIAHRSELVTQMSLAMAREGLRHRVVGSKSVQKDCVSLHMAELGRSLYDANSPVGVCSIDTLVNRDVTSDSWYRNTGLWVGDEAHHFLRGNKWGKGVSMFSNPNCLGLGFTATAARADGQGLGSDSDGLFDDIVHSEEMRWFIDQGFLTDYRIFTVESDVDYSEVSITPSGELSPAKLRAAVHKSGTLVGDVVQQYLKVGQGKLGVTFAVDVEEAQKLARAYRAAGVTCEVVTANTPDTLRASILRRFKNREIMQLVNVDLFGEGFDLPAIEVVSMARKTESWPLFVQQFGRALRLLVGADLMKIWGTLTKEERLYHIANSTKPVGIINDHVGNCARHGVPDKPNFEGLARRERRSTGVSDAIPLRRCMNPAQPACFKDFPRILKCCPFCGFEVPPPAERSSIEAVDGDLFELSQEVLDALRGKIEDVDGAPRIPGHLSPIAAKALQNRHFERQKAQGELRNTIALWSGWQAAQGFNIRDQHCKFYYSFGCSVPQAKALGRPEAEALTAKIKQLLDQHGVVQA